MKRSPKNPRKLKATSRENMAILFNLFNTFSIAETATSIFMSGAYSKT